MIDLSDVLSNNMVLGSKAGDDRMSAAFIYIGLKYYGEGISGLDYHLSLLQSMESRRSNSGCDMIELAV